MNRHVDTIVIHCSASPNGKPLSIETLDAWHAARGFKRRAPRVRPELGHIGYHRVILLDGTVALGRDLEEIGAHVSGSNARSVGICMVGTDRYTVAQWRSLDNLVRQMLLVYPKARVVGHRDLSPDLDGDGIVEPQEWLKTCPGFSVHDWLTSWRGRETWPKHTLGVA